MQLESDTQCLHSETGLSVNTDLRLHDLMMRHCCCPCSGCMMRCSSQKTLPPVPAPASLHASPRSSLLRLCCKRGSCPAKRIQQATLITMRSIHTCRMRCKAKDRTKLLLILYQSLQTSLDKCCNTGASGPAGMLLEPGALDY